MSENTNKTDKKSLITAYVLPETRAYIDERAAKERRKPHTMASMMLDDAAAAAKNGKNVL